MIIHTFDQYTDAWWHAHRGKPSASNFDKILTPSGDLSKQSRKYIYALLAEIYDNGYPNANEFQTAAMRTGTIMEPAARRFYEFERDCEIEEVGMITTDDDKVVCSPDGIIRGVRGLELKSPNTKTHVQYLMDGVLPTEYAPQCHGSMLVSGLDRWDFMSFSRFMPPLLIEVERNEYTERLAEALGEFLIEYDAAIEKIEAKFPPLPEPAAPIVTECLGFGTVEARGQESYF